MKHKGKEINLGKTIFKSIWIYLVSFFIFINAILFGISKIENNLNIPEICFYTLVLYFIIAEFANLIPKLTFYSYKAGGTNK